MGLTVTLFAGAALADSPTTASDIAGAVLTPLTVLPLSPEDGSPDDFCSGYRINPGSKAGKLVAARGWIVTSEASLGQYKVVSFSSGFKPGTSGICFARNSNLAIFDGMNLVALAYTARFAKWTLGKVEPLESGALLIWGGDGPGEPVGELRQENGDFRLTKVADERTFCHGEALVPNVYGKSIKEARTILIGHGWKPKKHAADATDDDYGAVRLVKHGIVEADSCSGTGVGYCEFDYVSRAGTLGVTTVGGDWDNASNDIVVDYGVACRAK